jgi:hypothetical protein
MKKLFLFLLLPFLSFGQLDLSDRAEISLITCGASQAELYSAFGHSAVRVYDPVQRLDIIFNYGVFNFDQPNFYLNFTRGNLLYTLSVGYFASLKANYIAENRFIHEQVLNLDSVQKQKYFDFLQWNAQADNAEYFYDYFYDNCATRVRDGLIEALGSEVLSIDSNYADEGKSIRDLCDLYLQEQRWGDLGIDICLGLPMDKKASTWEYMFLPDYLENAFAQAKLQSADGGTKPLVKSHGVLYTPVSQVVDQPMLSPFFAFALVLVLTIFLTMWSYAQPKKAQYFDFLLFLLPGLIGLLLTVLWLFTNHAAAANNFNILIFLPSHLILAIAMFKKKWSGFVKKLMQFMPYYYAILMALWIWLPQDLHLAFLPLCAAFILRSWHLSYKDPRFKMPRQ